ncbi:MAG: BatD family protein [Nonlabens sp.]|nr:BatD family protein [Nonlabens sp.]
MSKFLTLLFLTACLFTQAQVSFTSNLSRDEIGKNENLRVEFKMNVNGDNFTPPDFKDFTVVGGPSTSISQQWINGRGSMSKSFTYFLRPNRMGKIVIGQASMQYDGQYYTTDAVSVNVTAAIQQSQQQGSNSYQQGGTVSSSNEASKNIHLVAEVSEGNPYLNEPMRVVYKLYVSNNVGVGGWNEVKSPKYEDFWIHNIDNRNRQVQNGTYNGQPYRYLVLREAVLYPQKTGELTIEPLSLNIAVEVPTNRRDFLGRPYYSKENITVSAGARKIKVKDLPLEGRPASFKGAVGQLDFAVSLDKAALKAGESLTAKVKVSGSGNLKFLEIPKLVTPQSLEVFEPARTDNVTTSISGMRGSVVDDYTIVPQFGGKYKIPQVEFSYFDPTTEKFVTIKSEELLVEVDGPPPTSAAVASNKNVIDAVSPFAFIKNDTTLQPKSESQFFNSAAYWAILGGLVLLLPLALLVRNRREAMASDVLGNRIRTANKLSRKYLSEARKNLGNHDAFYVSLEKSLHNYLKSKLNIPTAEMSKERITELLAQRGASEDSLHGFTQLLASCEFARYTPSTMVSMQQDYDRASSVIDSLDKQLKRA